MPCLIPPTDINLLISKKWRMENLYVITDKNGNEVDFKLNWAQEELLNNFWHQMLILKARQLGCTTFFALSYLDDCFWTKNLAAGILANKKENAEDIFKKKVKYAYDRMPEWTRLFNSASNDRSGELCFKNGSSFRVSTGFRSGTYQRLLVSEFGNICAKSPEVSREIVTGSLNSVGRDQIIVIESTAEGREGYFYDFSQQAEQLAIAKKKLSPMEMRFFFFPWFREPDYRERDESVVIPKEINEYIDKIEMDTNITIDDDQRRWYHLKHKILQDMMKQEYPSTSKEAFESSNEGLFYGQQISKARADGRICRVPYSEYSPVYTAWDIGLDDYMSIWCFQVNPAGEIQLINFYENSDEGPLHYSNWLRDTGYNFHTHIMPHDAGNRSVQTNKTFADIMKPLLQGKIIVLERSECDIFTGIQLVRSILSRCVFDEAKCSKGVKHLESYRKQWNDKLGCYKSAPEHNSASHASDSFRYLALGLPKVGAMNKSAKSDYEALRSYFGD